MSTDTKIRWGWIKGMYIFTIIVAGLLGLAIIVMPETIKSTLPWPVEEPIAFGILGSVDIAFAFLSILGLRSPLKFVPVLLLQLYYKLIWLIGVAIPLLIGARYPSYGVPTIIIFALFIIGDLIAIPFSYIFSREASP